jgi:hypothetical protein
LQIRSPPGNYSVISLLGPDVFDSSSVVVPGDDASQMELLPHIDNRRERDWDGRCDRVGAQMFLR